MEVRIEPRLEVSLALRQVAHDLRTEAHTAGCRALLAKEPSDGRAFAALSSAIAQYAIVIDELANQAEDRIVSEDRIAS